MGVVYGVGGLREKNGELHFHPRLNHSITGVDFSLSVKGCLLKVNVKPKSTRYTLAKGDALKVYHKGKEVHLEKGESVECEQEPATTPEK
ncbi:MAG: glycosyl hydrolase family 65 protein [Owenweeksia sp.]|nr:glycosyl hydrolase family 65 protein [Owenweeksia sp.]